MNMIIIVVVVVVIIIIIIIIIIIVVVVVKSISMTSCDATSRARAAIHDVRACSISCFHRLPIVGRVLNSFEKLPRNLESTLIPYIIQYRFRFRRIG